MKVILVTYYLLGLILFGLAIQDIRSNTSGSKQFDNLKFRIDDLLLNTKILKGERRRDNIFLHSVQDRSSDGSHQELRKRRYKEKINKINRPFKHYGPPTHEHIQLHRDNYQQMSIGNTFKQEKDNLMTESPIASQNNEPFGQHTANYLPPKNQELPVYSSHHLFLNKNYDFPKSDHYQQHKQYYDQQPEYDRQQQHLYNQQQENQYYDQSQYDKQQYLQKQLLDNKQYSDFNNIGFSNLNLGENIFDPQQISDGALFLSENAQAISNLYGAAAPNENYAPNNQNYLSVHHDQQNDKDKKIEEIHNYQLQELLNYLPSYASGILNSQEAHEKLKLLEKNQILTQLQQTMSNQQISNYNAPHESFNTEHNISFINYPSISPSSSISSINGFYPSLGPISTTHITSPTSATWLQKNHGIKIIDNIETEKASPAPNNMKSSITDPAYFQYRKLIPSSISQPSLVPTTSNQVPLLSSTSLKSSSNSPTYFGIPIPTYSNVKALQPSKITTIVSKPPGSLYLNSMQSSIMQPNSFPITNSALQVHPTNGIHSAAVNSASIYQPMKTNPFYYYPNTAYQQLQKSIRVEQ